MKKCPFCAEEIQDEAIVCRYCGRELESSLPPEDRKKCPHCAEFIRAEAKICRYCGNSVEEQEPPHPMPPIPSEEVDAEQVRTEAKEWRWGAAFIIGLVFAFMAAMLRLSNLINIAAGISAGEYSPLVFRAGLQDFLLHFVTNLFIYGLVALFVLRYVASIWKAVVIMMGFLIGVAILLTAVEGDLISTSENDTHIEVGTIPTKVVDIQTEGTPTSYPCNCPMVSDAIMDKSIVGETICVSGVARNVSSEHFLLRGVSALEAYGVDGTIPPTIRTGDYVDVVAEVVMFINSKELEVVKSTDVVLCDGINLEKIGTPLPDTKPSGAEIFEKAAEKAAKTRQACEADPNCRLVTLTSPIDSWTPEVKRPTWTPSP